MMWDGRLPSRGGSPVHRETSAGHPQVRALCGAVDPFGWRSLTAETVVRRVLGALDRLVVLEVMDAAADCGRELAEVEPVERSDDRIEPLVAAMAVIRWRDLQLSRLVQLLLDALDQWWLHRDAVDRMIARLVDEPR